MSRSRCSSGWGFVGAGLVAWWGRPENRTGKLMVVTGFLWFVGSLQGFEDAVGLLDRQPVRRGLPRRAAIHLLLAFPTGRLATPRRAPASWPRTYFCDHRRCCCRARCSPSPRTSAAPTARRTCCWSAHEPAGGRRSRWCWSRSWRLYLLGQTIRILLRPLARASSLKPRTVRPVLGAGLVLMRHADPQPVRPAAGLRGAGDRGRDRARAHVVRPRSVHRPRRPRARPPGSRRRAQRAARPAGGDARPGRAARRPRQRPRRPRPAAGLSAAGLGPATWMPAARTWSCPSREPATR